jgi:hypothetical protein
MTCSGRASSNANGFTYSEQPPEVDFCGACGFLGELCGGEKDEVGQPPDPTHWTDNLDIVSGVDLFRFCLMRKLSAEHSERGVEGKVFPSA